MGSGSMREKVYPATGGAHAFGLGSQLPKDPTAVLKAADPPHITRFCPRAGPQQGVFHSSGHPPSNMVGSHAAEVTPPPAFPHRGPVRSPISREWVGSCQSDSGVLMSNCLMGDPQHPASLYSAPAFLDYVKNSLSISQCFYLPIDGPLYPVGRGGAAGRTSNFDHPST